MKRNGYKTLRRFKITLALIFCAAFIYLGGKAFLPVLWAALEKAAAISAAFVMPEAAAAHILDSLKPKESTVQPQESSEQASLSPQAATQPQITKTESRPEAVSAPPPSTAESENQAPPEIPEEQRGRVKAEDMSGKSGGQDIKISNFWVRNDTTLSQSDIEAVLKTPMKLSLEQTSEPQVLIYHTHATESYCPYDNGIYDKRYNWRSTDNNNNMVAVGAVLAQVLREKGIAVIHDTAQHDYPSYDGSYANSYRSMKDYLVHYPTIKVALDVHRDAIERENGLVIKPTATINGEKYAQLMIISNCDDGSGLIPNWRENFRFASAFCSKLEQDFPGITRPLLFSYRKYNQQLSTGALLLEFGSHANTMEEAQRTARAVGEALAQLLKDSA